MGFFCNCPPHQDTINKYQRNTLLRVEKHLEETHDRVFNCIQKIRMLEQKIDILSALLLKDNDANT